MVSMAGPEFDARDLGPERRATGTRTWAMIRCFRPRCAPRVRSSRSHRHPPDRVATSKPGSMGKSGTEKTDLARIPALSANLWADIPAKRGQRRLSRLDRREARATMRGCRGRRAVALHSRAHTHTHAHSSMNSDQNCTRSPMTAKRRGLERHKPFPVPATPPEASPEAGSNSGTGDLHYTASSEPHQLPPDV